MAKFAKLSFQKDELNKKLSAFFKGMLENGAVDAVLVLRWLRLKKGSDLPSLPLLPILRRWILLPRSRP